MQVQSQSQVQIPTEDLEHQWSKAWTVFHQPSQQRAWTTELVRWNDFQQLIPSSAPQTRTLANQLANRACPVSLGDAVVRHPPSCLWLVCATLAYENKKEEDSVSIVRMPAIKQLIRRVFSAIDWTSAIAAADQYLVDTPAHTMIWDLTGVWELLERVWSEDGGVLLATIGQTFCVRADATDAPQGTCARRSVTSAEWSGKCAADSNTLTPEYIDQAMSWLLMFMHRDYSLLTHDDVRARLHTVNFYELLEALIGDDGLSLVARCQPLRASLHVPSPGKPMTDNKKWLTDKTHPRNAIVILVYVLYRLNLFLVPPPLFAQLVEVCVAWPDSWAEFAAATDDWFRMGKRIAFVYQVDLVHNMRAFFTFFTRYEGSSPTYFKPSSEQQKHMTPRAAALEKLRTLIPVRADDVYRLTWKSHLHAHEQRRIQQVADRAKQDQRVFARRMPAWYAQWLSVDTFTRMATVDQTRRDMRFHQLDLGGTLHAIVDACQLQLSGGGSHSHSYQHMQAFLRLIQSVNACSENESIRAVRHPLMGLWCWMLASLHVDFVGDWLTRDADRRELAQDLFQQVVAQPMSLADQVNAAGTFWKRHLYADDDTDHVAPPRFRIRPSSWVPTPESVSFDALAVLVQIAALSVEHWPASMCRCAPFGGKRISKPISVVNTAEMAEQMARVQLWLETPPSNAPLVLEQRVLAGHLRNLNVWDVFSQLCSGGPYADPFSLAHAQDLFSHTHPRSLTVEDSLTDDNETFLRDDKRWIDDGPGTQPNLLVLTTLVLYRASIASHHLADNPALVHQLALTDECAKLLYTTYTSPSTAWNPRAFLLHLAHIAPVSPHTRLQHKPALVETLANLVIQRLTDYS
jgi:hypothetical protein